MLTEPDRETGKLRDLFGRRLNYVRISVTDRCNYRCRYCMPEEGIEWVPHDRIMTYEDILFLAGVLRSHGVEKLRFTGGEPLVRKGMASFPKRLCSLFPDMRTALTTNGSTLVRHARELVRSGLSSLNISLDTLSPEKFAAMTRGGVLRDVLDGVDALLEAGVLDAGISLKMNSVLFRGFNDQEAEDLLKFACSKGILLRFIEFMPMDGDLWSWERFVPFQEILARLPDPFGWKEEENKEERNGEKASLAGPARYYVNVGTGWRVGIIAALSRHFCSSCNRLRVTATGEIRSCLFARQAEKAEKAEKEISVLEALRARDEKTVSERLFEAASLKPEAGGIINANQNEHRQMSRIGG